MSRRRGKLSEEDKTLWEAVKKTAIPLRTDLPRIPPEDLSLITSAPLPPEVRLPSLSKIKSFKMGGKAAKPVVKKDLAPTIADHIKNAPLQMDQKKFGKMRRGKLKPEARIDLHGMTLAQAQPALSGFILSSHRRGFRLVLVITGKGKDRDEGGPIPTRLGVLKNQVPHWLTSGALRPVVMQVTEAHLTHGGSGAYYVYLRRLS
jgi:DNA-nicking Smr family endonuclease